MQKILYVHGLSSSGNSRTAKVLQNLLPHFHIVSPDLPINAQKALELLIEICRTINPDLIIGTSMGGMFTQQLRGYKKILVNPSFHVSEVLKQNIGIQKFLNKRTDGAENYEITVEICSEYTDMEKKQFENITELERGITWAMFGKYDSLVNCLDEYKSYYSNYIIFEGEHRLSQANIENTLLPLIRKILHPLAELN